MNRLSAISDRAQQKYITGQQTVLLLEVLRLCPCDEEVGCKACNGLGEYYDNPVIIKGIFANGRNRSEKKTEFPLLDKSEYELTLHPKYQVAKGDRVLPFKLNIFETYEERISKDDKLSFHPARATTVQLYFSAEGRILNYKNGTDFIIEKEFNNLINSRTIKWINPPPVNRKKFVARYQRLPEYAIAKIPEAKIAEGKRIMQTLTLTKILAPSETDKMTSSGENAAVTITKGGMQSE